MSRTIKIINIVVFCTWAALISILLYKDYTGASLEKLEALRESFDIKTYWYDIYNGDKKIGIASTTFEKAGDEIIIKHEREIKAEKDDKETLLIHRLRYLCDTKYIIKSFEYTTKFKGEKGITVRGEVDEEDIIFFIESPEKRRTQRISTNGRDPFLPITLIPSILQKKPVVNSKFLLPVLNLGNLSIDDVTVVLEEIRPVKIGIHVQSIYKFRVGNLVLWSNVKGIIVKESLPTGITLYSQIKSIADEIGDRILFDYTSLPFFKSNELIPDPERLSMLRVKIKGFELDPGLYEDSLVTLKNDTLTIEKEEIEDMEKNTYTLPNENDKLSVYIKPDEWVSSDHKPLQDTGRIYARAHKYDAFLLAKYLNGYLYQLIKTMPMFVLSDSRTVLKSLSGDYMERAIMFASYARAGGLPTRLVSGLIYKDGYFYFHAWPEVWLNKWIPVDPGFVQFPADVTHIPLKEGTLKDIVSILEDLKDIKIKILEAS